MTERISSEGLCVWNNDSISHKRDRVVLGAAAARRNPVAVIVWGCHADTMRKYRRNPKRSGRRLIRIRRTSRKSFHYYSAECTKSRRSQGDQRNMQASNRHSTQQNPPHKYRIKFDTLSVLQR